MSGGEKKSVQFTNFGVILREDAVTSRHSSIGSYYAVIRPCNRNTSSARGETKETSKERN